MTERLLSAAIFALIGILAALGLVVTHEGIAALPGALIEVAAVAAPSAGLLGFLVGPHLRESPIGFGMMAMLFVPVPLALFALSLAVLTQSEPFAGLLPITFGFLLLGWYHTVLFLIVAGAVAGWLTVHLLNWSAHPADREADLGTRR